MKSRGQRSMWARVKDIWLLGWGSDSWGQVLQGCLKMWHGFSQLLLHMQSLKFQSHFTLGTRKVVNLCVCMFECIIIHWRSKFTDWFLSLATSGTVLSWTGKVWSVCAIQSLNAIFIMLPSLQHARPRLISCMCDDGESVTDKSDCVWLPKVWHQYRGL